MRLGFSTKLPGKEARKPAPAVKSCGKWSSKPGQTSERAACANFVLKTYEIAGDGYRALSLREADRVTWFWIGSHSEYDKKV